MPLSPTAIAAVVAAVIIVALIALFRRSGSGRTPTRGPDNLHFVCARCKGQFNHTKRTVAAWERGSRRFFCNSCHRVWREVNPAATPKAAQDPQEVLRSTPLRGRAPARSGCLSVIVVVAVVPLVLYAVARYAYPFAPPDVRQPAAPSVARR